MGFVDTKLRCSFHNADSMRTSRCAESKLATLRLLAALQNRLYLKRVLGVAKLIDEISG